MPLHICPGCGIAKPHDLEHFYAHKSRKGGLHTICKLCMNITSAVRSKALREAGLPRIADPDKMTADLERRRIRNNEKYHEDVEASRAAARAWYATSYGRLAKSIASARRRGRLYGSTEHYDDNDLAHLHATQLGLCHYCQRTMTSGPGPLQTWVDHMDPLIGGGSNAVWNIVLACRTCNLMKHDQPYDDFIARTDRPNINTPP